MPGGRVVAEVEGQFESGLGLADEAPQLLEVEREARIEVVGLAVRPALGTQALLDYRLEPFSLVSLGIVFSLERVMSPYACENEASFSARRRHRFSASVRTSRLPVTTSAISRSWFSRSSVIVCFVASIVSTSVAVRG